MKPPTLAFTLTLASLPVAAPAQQIFADFSTSFGDFTIELDYVAAPRTVASFIKLAEGTALWMNEDTQQVMSGPYYDGMRIHRVVNGLPGSTVIPEFKILQTGQETADEVRSPGYSFPDDEISLPHGAYVISMANRGPNTNSAQIFITGDQANPVLDTPARHTVFGQIPASDVVGRVIVDLIIASVPSPSDQAPNPPITINSVTIRRVGGVVFDECAQGVSRSQCEPLRGRFRRNRLQAVDDPACSVRGPG